MMKKIVLLLTLIMAPAVFGQVTTSTNVGRDQIAHPDFTHQRGIGLHTKIRDAWTAMSDDISGRFDAYSSIANATTTTVTHNLGFVLADIGVQIYSGTHPTLTKVCEVAGTSDDCTGLGWLIAAGPTPNTQIDVTTPPGGGPHTFAVVIGNGGGGGAADLQGAYEGGNSINTSPGFGPILVTGDQSLDLTMTGVVPALKITKNTGVAQALEIIQNANSAGVSLTNNGTSTGMNITNSSSSGVALDVNNSSGVAAVDISQNTGNANALRVNSSVSEAALYLDAGPNHRQIKMVAADSNDIEIFTTAVIPTSWDWTLPPDNGDPGEVLQTNGNGVTTWEPGGATDLQSAFDGGENIVIADTVNKTVTITNNNVTDDPIALRVVNNNAQNNAIRVETTGAAIGVSGVSISHGATGSSSSALDVRATAGVGATAKAAFFRTDNDAASASVEATSNGTSVPVFKASTVSSGSSFLAVASTAPAHDFNFKQAFTSSWDWTIPPDDGDAGEFLQTDGNGVTTWESVPSPSLQDVFDVAQTITIADTDNQTLLMTNNDTTNNPKTLSMVNTSNGGDITIDHNGSFGKSIEILHSSGSQALDISHDGNSAAATVEIESTSEISVGPGMLLTTKNLGPASVVKKLDVVSIVAPAARGSVLELGNEETFNTSPLVDINQSGPGRSVEIISTNGVGTSALLHIKSANSAGPVAGNAHIGLEAGDASGTVGIEVPVSGVTSYSIQLPASQGGAGTSLSNDGTGVLSWVSTPAADTRQSTYDAGPDTSLSTASLVVDNDSVSPTSSFSIEASNAEVTELLVGNSGTFFDVVGSAKAVIIHNGDNGRYYFWFNVTDGSNSQTDPAIGGTQVQVDILDADTASDIAGKLQSSIDTLPDFGAGVATATVTVTNAKTGESIDASIVDSALTSATVTTQGSGSPYIKATSSVNPTLMKLESTYGGFGGFWEPVLAITSTNPVGPSIGTPQGFGSIPSDDFSIKTGINLGGDGGTGSIQISTGGSGSNPSARGTMLLDAYSLIANADTTIYIQSQTGLIEVSPGTVEASDDFNGGTSIPTALTIRGSDKASGSAKGGDVVVRGGDGFGIGNNGGDLLLRGGDGVGAGLPGVVRLGGDLDLNGNSIIDGATTILTLAGSGNVGLGEDAQAGYLGVDSVAIGTDAMSSVAVGTASENVAIGSGAMDSASLGDARQNVAIGQNSMTAITTGDGNVAIGQASAQSLTTSIGNTIIGQGADNIGTKSFSIALGTNAVLPPGAGSPMMQLGNAIVGGNGRIGLIQIGPDNTTIKLSDHTTADATQAGSFTLRSGKKTAGTGGGGDIILDTGTGFGGGSKGIVKAPDDAANNGAKAPNLDFQAGNKTAGTGNGGDVTITTGTGFGGGAVGDIKLSAAGIEGLGVANLPSGSAFDFISSASGPVNYKSATEGLFGTGTASLFEIKTTIAGKDIALVAGDGDAKLSATGGNLQGTADTVTGGNSLDFVNSAVGDVNFYAGNGSSTFEGFSSDGAGILGASDMMLGSLTTNKTLSILTAGSSANITIAPGTDSDIILQTNGTGDEIILTDGNANNVGDVWTATDTAGSGQWQTPGVIVKKKLESLAFDVTGSFTASELCKQVFTVGQFPDDSIITEALFKVTTAITGDANDDIRTRGQLYGDSGCTTSAIGAGRSIETNGDTNGNELRTAGSFSYVNTVSGTTDVAGTNGLYIRMTDNSVANATIDTGNIDVKITFITP